jgi:hypothetical protein
MRKQKVPSPRLSMYTLPKILYKLRHLSGGRGVEALLGLRLLECLHGEGGASLRTSRLVNTREPDLPATTDSAGAGLEANVARKASSSEDKVTIIVDLKGATLLVLADWLDTGGVADVAIAHAAAVDVQLERGVEGVDVDAAGLLVEGEGSVVDAAGGVVAVAVDDAGLVVLVGRVDDEAALTGLDVTVVDGGGGAERHQTEDVTSLRAREGRRRLGKGGGQSGHGGSGGSGGELHVDCLEVVLLKFGSGGRVD